MPFLTFARPAKQSRMIRPSAPGVDPAPPADVPAIVPVPAPAAVSPWTKAVAWLLGLNLAFVAGVLGVLAYDHYHPAVPAPGAVDGVKLGKAFARPLALSLADGFDAMASDLEGSQPMGKANDHLKAAFQASRQSAFATLAAPAFAAIVPEGAEPADQASRAAYVKLARDFARGLRGGK